MNTSEDAVAKLLKTWTVCRLRRLWR